MKRKGFTILELAVSMTLVTLLMAMLFPVFASARSAAARTQSLSNVRQISLAQFLYKEDYDDAIAMNRDCNLQPPGGAPSPLWPCIRGVAARGWIDLTMPYVGSYQVFKSPLDRTPAVPLPEGAQFADGQLARHGFIWGDRLSMPGFVRGGDYRSSYARNNNFANNGVYTARFSEPSSPSTLVLIYSFAANTGAGASGSEGVSGSSFTIIRRGGVQPEPGSCRPYDPTSEGNHLSNFLYSLPEPTQAQEARTPSSERYSGKGIYGFADGHAKVLRPERIRGQCQWGNGQAGVETGNDGITPDFRF